VPKITSNTEISIWKNSIHTWQDLIDRHTSLNIAPSKKAVLIEHLSESINALKKKNYSHFNTLPLNQHWRMYSTLKQHSGNICFLDIETTGLSKYRDDITLIGIHGNEGTKIFMKDKNLEKFENELKKYSMIITFNGKCFDVPFIKSKFSDASIPLYHADLRYLMAELGFRGGLKHIEVARGITRADELQGVDGFEAVRLWHRYERGDNSALATLKSYLTADVENLRLLMDAASIELKKKNFENLISN
jgi:uncharacterized protein YprB with RNaseH-like and TPR domain